MATPAQLASALPQKPGVYTFFGADNEILYIGKAKRLRSRVSSYFRPAADLTPAKALMVQLITRLETIIVRTETEALLLESTLIKKFRPKYNILLTDDKFYQYIRIGLAEAYPSITTVRRVVLDGSQYFGPYPSGFAVRQTLKLLKRLFPYKNCPNPPETPCFDAQLGRCLGHDTGPGSQERYAHVIKQLVHFLQGHTGGVLRELRRAMAIAAKKHDYENAARYRDRLQALEHVLADQAVVTTSRESFDVLGLARRERTAMIAVLQVRQGKLVQRNQHPLRTTIDATDPEILQAFISQYYAQSTAHPSAVIVPTPVEAQLETALQIHIHHATRGVKRRLLTIAHENALEAHERQATQESAEQAKISLALEELTHGLSLPRTPRRIEMYDVSNFQGRHAVASMVVFEDGRAKPSAYRKFTIRNTNIPDDMHRLAEVIRRRFARHDESGWPLPDLLLLDGGIPQLNVVLRSVPGLLEHVPVAALAKEHEEVFVPGQRTSIRFTKGSAELHLLQNIRDEAHRFAISFYRHKHRRETVRSILDTIPGVGPTTIKALRNAFGTIQNIRQASDDDLAHVVGPKRVHHIRNHIG